MDYGEEGMFNAAGGSYRSQQQPDAMTQKLHEVEERVEVFFRNIKPALPVLSRLFLVATFMEDGLRMWFGFDDQYSFFTRPPMAWPGALATMFVFVNFLMQVGGSAAVISGRGLFIDVGVGLLAANVLLQLMVYTPLWSLNYFMRSLALLGSLAMVMAEATNAGRRSTHFDFAPEASGKEKAKPYVQLVGRMLIVLLFLTLIHGDMSGFRVLMTCIEFALVICVAIGFRARAAAFVLSAILLITNFFMNAWWMLPTYQQDYVRYEFFQQLSVVGGLLALVLMGAGNIAVDGKKRR